MNQFNRGLDLIELYCVYCRPSPGAVKGEDSKVVFFKLWRLISKKWFSTYFNIICKSEILLVGNNYQRIWVEQMNKRGIDSSYESIWMVNVTYKIDYVLLLGDHSYQKFWIYVFLILPLYMSCRLLPSINITEIYGFANVLHDLYRHSSRW